jgi:hypothetical protein
MGMLTSLSHLPDAGHTGGAQQLAKLGQVCVLVIRNGGDHERALTRTPGRPLPVGRRRRILPASVSISLHKVDGSFGVITTP